MHYDTCLTQRRCGIHRGGGRLPQRLEEEGAGLRLSTITKDGDEDYTRIPCLAFADDVVLMAETAADMQQLMNICTEEASRDNFKFNAEKTQWLSFNTEGDQKFYLQNHVVKKTTSYKYLGVTITSDKDYLAQHERNMVAKSNQLKGAVWHLARHSYNKYSVGRILWKTLAVPAVTYANDALTYSAAGIKGLDRHQYELGRWLLGGSSCTANTAVTARNKRCAESAEDSSNVAEPGVLSPVHAGRRLERLDSARADAPAAGQATVTQ
ncbi:hypothetical protein HPB47_001258, partial [Ixodes persulcatus]